MDKTKIYNTLSRKKEILKPLKGKRFNIFVCGPTVYDFSHIGHARTCIFFDGFAKYLKKIGYKVFYLQNITDLDDKIIIRAKEKGVLPKDLAIAFEKDYFKNMKSLGINKVDKYARATDYIKEIIGQIEKLLEKGFAYKLDDGIYFDIVKFKNYGKLSGRKALQSDDAVSRIDYNKNKKNRGDFCIWKLNQQNSLEPSFDSPFGQGRPGWHIEDTAITEKFFGPQYDIHGGGMDLIFPHHEAEIAQMEAISGKSPMVKYWMHVGFLTTEGQKMSKSLNNFITISDFLKRYPYRHLRFWVFKNLWRHPVDYSDSSMQEVKSALEKIEEFIRKITNHKSQIPNKPKLPKSKIQNLLKKVKNDFYKNLNDDFNTPKAFAAIFEFIKSANKVLEKSGISKKESAEILKFFEQINDIFDIIDLKNLGAASIPDEIKKILTERENYRKAGDFTKADELRKEIEKYGFTVEDTKEGTALKKIESIN